MPVRPHLQPISGTQREYLPHRIPGFPAWSGARKSHGFTMLELTVVLLIAGITAAFALPVLDASMTTMRMNSAVSAMSAAISNTRYRAIKDSQVYTVVLTTPANTYVVTNVSTATADAAVPLPYTAIAFNGGTSATYTFTLCPNGTVYGAGGTCPGNTTPPTLAATFQNREIDLTVSSAGNVTTKII